MAFSDLINKPIATPLEGLDKSIATGVELANSQYRTQLAMEQNQIEKEKVQMAYLDKANAMLPSLLKSKGKTRQILVNQYKAFSNAGGQPVNDDAFEASISLSPEQLDAAYNNILSSVGGNKQRAALIFGAKFREDAPETVAWVEKSASQSLAFQNQTQLELLRRQGVKETAVAGQKLKRLVGVSEQVNKATEDTSKQIGEVNRSISSIKSAIQSNDYKRLQTIIGDLAKGIGGLSGVLSDLDMKTQLSRSLGTDIAGLEGYLTGKAAIPKATRNQIEARMTDFTNSLSKEATGRLLNQISNRQLDPGIGDAYKVAPRLDKSGKATGLEVGFAAARLIDRSNKVLQQLGTVKGQMSLEDYIGKQAAPISQQKLTSVIQQAANQGIVIRFLPTSVISPPSPEEIYGVEPVYSAPTGLEGE